MSVIKDYAKIQGYYSADVCKQDVCSPVTNLVKFGDKRDVNTKRNALFMRDNSDSNLFVPARVIESALVSKITGTLQESGSCWDIDPCHKNIKKYCCGNGESDTTPEKNNGDAYWLVFVFIILLVFITVAIMMLLWRAS